VLGSFGNYRNSGDACISCAIATCSVRTHTPSLVKQKRRDQIDLILSSLPILVVGTNAICKTKKNQRSSRFIFLFFFSKFASLSLSLSLATDLLSFFIGSMPPLLTAIFMVEDGRRIRYCNW